MDIPAAHQNIIGHLDGEEAVDELLGMADHLGLADQQVDGHDEAQEGIGDDLHRVDHPVEHAADQGVQAAQSVGQVFDVGDQVLGRPLVQVGGYRVINLLCRLSQAGVILPQLGQQLVPVLDIGREGGDDAHDTVDEVGQHQGKQATQQDQGEEDGDGHGQGYPHAPRPSRPQFPLERILEVAQEHIVQGG